jgi:Glycosyl hydrolase family 12
MRKVWVALAVTLAVVAGVVYAVTIQRTGQVATNDPSSSPATPFHLPSPPPSAKACVTSAPSGACGPYKYSSITWNNGYNTNVGNNMWGCGNGNCGAQKVNAYNPGNWSVTSTQPAGNTAVLTYPDIQQVFAKWDGSGDVAVRRFASITSDFAEAMQGGSGTDAEAAYDIWLSGTTRHEVMIWVDNVGRGNGGASRYGHVTIAGQGFTVYTYGSEIIVSLDKNETSGTVDILATLRWLQTQRLVSSSAALAQVDFGWEICSTGGRPEMFAVSKYNLTSKCVATGCMG